MRAKVGALMLGGGKGKLLTSVHIILVKIKSGEMGGIKKNRRREQ